MNLRLLWNRIFFIEHRILEIMKFTVISSWDDFFWNSLINPHIFLRWLLLELRYQDTVVSRLWVSKTQLPKIKSRPVVQYMCLYICGKFFVRALALFIWKRLFLFGEINKEQHTVYIFLTKLPGSDLQMWEQHGTLFMAAAIVHM